MKPQSVALAAELVLDIYPGNICPGQIVTTPIQPQLKSKVWCDAKITLIHHHHTNSMSSISQRLQTRFQPNFKVRFLGLTTTTTTTTTTTIITHIRLSFLPPFIPSVLKPSGYSVFGDVHFYG